MKVYLFGNPRDCEGSDLVDVFASRQGAVDALLGMLTAGKEYTACQSIAGFDVSESVEDAVAAFLSGEATEVGVMDDDDSTVGWVQEREVLQ